MDFTGSFNFVSTGFGLGIFEGAGGCGGLFPSEILSPSLSSSIVTPCLTVKDSNRLIDDHSGTKRGNAEAMIANTSLL